MPLGMISQHGMVVACYVLDGSCDEVWKSRHFMDFGEILRVGAWIALSRKLMSSNDLSSSGPLVNLRHIGQHVHEYQWRQCHLSESRCGCTLAFCRA